MLSPHWEEQTLGHFALVSYIPDPLAQFLDDLRRELVPGCKPHAHVTVIPPRPLFDDLNTMTPKLALATTKFAPFWVETGEIETFERTNVVYLGLAGGEKELREMYGVLSCGDLEHAENYPYHPHITIAQNIQAEDVARLKALAQERWAAYRGPRGFLVETLSFVQHVAPSIWIDIAPMPLAAEVPAGVAR